MLQCFTFKFHIWAIATPFMLFHTCIYNVTAAGIHSQVVIVGFKF